MRDAPRVAIASQPKNRNLFGSAQRLHSPRDFAAVLDTRKAVRGSCFDLHYRFADPGAPARLGLIVPKRMARRAVLRNKIKRLGREAFRQLQTAIPHYDVVLRLVRPLRGADGRSGDVNSPLWRREIEGLLRLLPPPSQ